MSRRTLILLLLLLTPHMASGAVALIRDVRYEERAEHIDLSILLGPAVRLEAISETRDGRRFELKLAGEAGGKSDWRASELKFDEADRLLDTVAVEGSDRRGYQLNLTFTDAVVVQALPQLNRHQLFLKLALRADYRALSRAERHRDDDRFVINLQSRQQGIPSLEDLPPGYMKTHRIYISRFEQGGAVWYRHRLGFFDGRAEAQNTLNILRRYYPDAWLDQAGAREQHFAEIFQINPEQLVARGSTTTVAKGAVAEPAPEVRLTVELETPTSLAQAPAPAPEDEPIVWTRKDPAPETPPTELERLLEEARHAFEDEDWATAISRYGAVVEAGQEPLRQTALEMLGTSRELNDQAAHAKRYYELYLEEYPGTEGAERVAQRLAVLVALDQPAPVAAASRATTRSTGTWRNALYFSQFYQRHSLTVDGETTVPLDGLINDLNLMSRRAGSELDQEFRITASYLADFTGNERLDGREFSVSTAYWDAYSRELDMGLRLGRQSNWETGALGRFDGASFTYRPIDNIGLGLSSGLLIDSSFDAPGGERPFFSLSGEYLSDSGNLSVKPFFVQQYADGVIDRQALGASSQYYSERMVLFALVDYDLHHSALNNITLTGNFTFGQSQLNASYEHRMSPYLTTRNALMGQTLEDLTELEEALLELTLEEIARDRTAESDTLRLGWNRRFGAWTLNADLVATDFSATEPSLDVPGLESHKTLYSSVQIRSADIFGRGSYSGLMLRIADSDGGDVTSFYWDNRLAFGNRWFLYPRLRVDLRSFSETGDEQTRVRPTLRLDYRSGRRLRFELEGGYEWLTRELTNRDLDMTGFFIRAGYRASL